MQKCGYVYIIGNWTSHVIYVGVTSDLLKRMYQHKNKVIAGFSSRYNLSKLLYFEQFGDITLAIVREKEIKGFRREKKNALIAGTNPSWNDLSAGWFEDPSACRVRDDGAVNL